MQKESANWYDILKISIGMCWEMRISKMVSYILRQNFFYIFGDEKFISIKKTRKILKSKFVRVYYENLGLGLNS